jgi:hypothetical protein
MVLRAGWDVLSNTIMTDGQVEEGPLHGLHDPYQIWILWIFICGDT